MRVTQGNDKQVSPVEQKLILDQKGNDVSRKCSTHYEQQSCQDYQNQIERKKEARVVKKLKDQIQHLIFKINFQNKNDIMLKYSERIKGVISSQTIQVNEAELIKYIKQKMQSLSRKQVLFHFKSDLKNAQSKMFLKEFHKINRILLEDYSRQKMQKTKLFLLFQWELKVYFTIFEHLQTNLSLYLSYVAILFKDIKCEFQIANSQPLKYFLYNLNRPKDKIKYMSGDIKILNTKQPKIKFNFQYLIFIAYQYQNKYGQFIKKAYPIYNLYFKKQFQTILGIKQQYMTDDEINQQTKRILQQYLQNNKMTKFVHLFILRQIKSQVFDKFWKQIDLYEFPYRLQNLVKLQYFQQSFQKGNGNYLKIQYETYLKIVKHCYKSFIIRFSKQIKAQMHLPSPAEVIDWVKQSGLSWKLERYSIKHPIYNQDIINRQFNF